MCQKHRRRHKDAIARSRKKHLLSPLASSSSTSSCMDRRKFILVTNHKPLIVLFAPTKPIPALATNRLARWALTLSQYSYTIEYRKTLAHGNADALSRLPAVVDPSFDREETGADSTTICTIKIINSQIKSSDPKALQKTTSTDSALKTVMKYMYLQHSWPKNISDKLKSCFALRDSLTLANGCVFYGHRVTWCAERGFEHLHGALYHPKTNGAAERLIQTFKHSLKKSDLPPGDTLQEFLMHYRRTPLAGGNSRTYLIQLS
ncbi:hypothetical protein EGW08_005483 [Elysia chlorotica]|uniref:Uncharacterized protein n=1 Tax=Elysia chlorotica TaxID=188477 RepID=A0A3S1BLZ7_ELYCH|nr:hypothetical protein EGW08_005483 [Elysia chlorotica]